MERELQLTADGSHTLFVPRLNEHYHSVNGAVQESCHIFIGAGLHAVEKENIRLLEIGFGTGLNAFLTLCDGMQSAPEAGRYRHIDYYAVELYPLEREIVRTLNYGERAGVRQRGWFEQLHAAPWNTAVAINDRFTLHKIAGDSRTCDLPKAIDLIYFDAFAPDKQPEMWEAAMFERLYAVSAPGARIVTYCAKGEVRRRMQAAGYRMERLPGPPGKRHMLSGCKEMGCKEVDGRELID